jgi:hypothetical protein
MGQGRIRDTIINFWGDFMSDISSLISELLSPIQAARFLGVNRERWKTGEHVGSDRALSHILEDVCAIGW